MQQPGGKKTNPQSPVLMTRVFDTQLFPFSDLLGIGNVDVRDCSPTLGPGDISPCLVPHAPAALILRPNRDLLGSKVTTQALVTGDLATVRLMGLKG